VVVERHHELLTLLFFSAPLVKNIQKTKTTKNIQITKKHTKNIFSQKNLGLTK